MPAIGIIGTQNVGKSTLFNALIRRNKSITFDSPGVTRDLVTESVNWGEGRWEVTDFPGFESEKNMPDDEIGRAAVEKALKQLDNFNLLLWVVSRKGLSVFEHLLLEKIRKIKKPVWLVVNFVDDPALESSASEFYSLGFSTVFFVSALNRRNINELRDSILHKFQGKIQDAEAEQNEADESIRSGPVKLAIVGKPNAGKSTLFNTFLGQERSLVYDMPGTTRDSIQEPFTYDGHEIILIDTAGIRRKKLSFESLEVFSVARTKKAITEADVLIMLVDAREGFDKQNKSILEWVESENKPLLVAINKTDLVDEEQRAVVTLDIEKLQEIFWDFPVYWISALSPKKSGRVLAEAIRIAAIGNEKVATPVLNDILEVLNRNPVVSSNRLKFNYITQAWPEKKFIIFGNRESVPDNVKRYLKHNLLKQLKWKDIPIKIEFRNKTKIKPAFLSKKSSNKRD
ncbi:MAG: ribosome biogenesis GTPase Der [Spirochaetia bacterium]|nr:ribosome biogenesis GTPase Der [Spirochaetia bacterium]